MDAASAPGDKNQSTNIRRLSGPINSSSARHSLYASNSNSNNCPGFKPTAIMRRSFRTEPLAMTTSSSNTNSSNNSSNCCPRRLNNAHNERWPGGGGGGGSEEGGSHVDEGDSEVERFNFEGIQISYSSPAVPRLDMDSASPPAAKLFHCEATAEEAPAAAAVAAPVSPKRRPLKHHNHQRMQRLQRPCLDFDKMQQVSEEGEEGEVELVVLMA